jgi:predicted MFS family arabinose efflux permease
MAPPKRRGTAYGLFNTWYGLAWFLGSATLGVLYDYSLPTLIAVSVGLQLAAVVVLLRVAQRRSE